MTFFVQTLVMQRPGFTIPGWQHTAPDADVQTWFPAVHTQTRQYRVSGRDRLSLHNHSRYNERWEWIAPYIETIPTFIDGALGMLRDSYRMPSGARLDVQRHAMSQLSEIMRGVFVDEFDIFKWPAIESLLRSFRTVERKGFKPDPRYLAGVRLDSVIEPVTANVVLFMAGLRQLTDSYRSKDHLRLDARYLSTLDDLASIVQPVVAVPFDASLWPAFEQLLRSYRSIGNPQLDSRLLRTWDDIGAVLQPALEPAFDPANWPAIQQLLNSFRADQGRRIDPALIQFVQSLDWIRSPLGLEDQAASTVRRLLTMLVGR